MMDKIRKSGRRKAAKKHTGGVGMEQKDQPRKDKGSRKITSKQAAAMTGVILLLLLYAAALIAALCDSTDTGKWFMGCILATVAMPVFIWIYIWIYGKITGSRTPGDPDDDRE